MIKRCATCVLGLAALAILGCGGRGGPDTVPVSGEVSYDGKPLADAEVNFYCAEHDFLGTGLTDSKGHYQLFQGAAVGANKVWISTRKVNPVNPTGDIDMAEHPEMDDVQLDAMTGDPAEPDKKNKVVELPEGFSNPDKTILKFNVPSGGTEDANFRLTKGS